MKYKFNVLADYPYTKHYYLTHPWAFLCHTKVNFVNAWNRITKGYCYADLWNYDWYVESLIEKTLEEFISKMNGWHPTEEIKTFEEYKAKLKELLAQIRTINRLNEETDLEVQEKLIGLRTQFWTAIIPYWDGLWI